jgi:ArsR family transcriptional regulator, arsenate/arsenite/antimonite-responsive transcriptional repressor
LARGTHWIESHGEGGTAARLDDGRGFPADREAAPNIPRCGNIDVLQCDVPVVADGEIKSLAPKHSSRTSIENSSMFVLAIFRRLSKYQIMNSLFKAFNDPTRRQILEMLRTQPLTAGDIADACDVGKPTISHHLDILKQAELIEEERQGQFRRYHLNTSVVEDVVVWLSGLVRKENSHISSSPASGKLNPRPSK